MSYIDVVYLAVFKYPTPDPIWRQNVYDVTSVAVFFAKPLLCTIFADFKKNLLGDFMTKVQHTSLLRRKQDEELLTKGRHDLHSDVDCVHCFLAPVVRLKALRASGVTSPSFLRQYMALFSDIFPESVLVYNG